MQRVSGVHMLVHQRHGEWRATHGKIYSQKNLSLTEREKGQKMAMAEGSEGKNKRRQKRREEER